ncbi:unnamed protein product [Amoebophrya sp. A120]|nr:unnamed protein product [Amoebophrya sp. A120]|eukprot:GSA120T00019477001.1
MNPYNNPPPGGGPPPNNPYGNPGGFGMGPAGAAQPGMQQPLGGPQPGGMGGVSGGGLGGPQDPNQLQQMMQQKEMQLQQLSQQFQMLQQQKNQQDVQLLETQSQLRNFGAASQELDMARQAMRDRDLQDQEQGQKMRELQMLLDRERHSRQMLDEELMKTRQERNMLQEQNQNMNSQNQQQDSTFQKSIKSQTELLKHLSDLEDMNAKLDKDNSDLKRQIDLLKSSDSKQKEIDELHDHLDELEAKLHQSEKDVEEFERENHYLKATLEEKTVQLEAAHRFEAEYDHHVHDVMTKKEEELTAKEKEAQVLAAKVSSLEHEINEVRKIAGLSSNSGSLEDLMTMVHDRDMEIEHLYDRIDKLETSLGEKIEQFKHYEKNHPFQQEEKQQFETMIAELRSELQHKDEKLHELEKQKSEFLHHLSGDEPGKAFDWDKKMTEMRLQNTKLKQELSETKQELSTYLNEASNIMYENTLLRQWSNIPSDQLLDLSEVKLKEKVSASKAVSMQKQLEKEILDLEDERLQLKMKLRSLAGLASEKSILFNGMEPDQMLQLEQIAETMRRGSLHLPETDNSRELRKKVDALESQLARKDKQVSDMLSQHVDRKMDDVVSKVTEQAQLKERCLLLEKENLELKQIAQSAGVAVPQTSAASSGASMLKMASGLAGMMKGNNKTGGPQTAEQDSALQKQLAAIQKQQQDQLAMFQQQMQQGVQVREQIGTQTSPTTDHMKAQTPTTDGKKKISAAGGKLLGAAASLRRAQAEEQKKKLEDTEKKLQEQEKLLASEQKKREEDQKSLSDAEKAKQEAERKARALSGKMTEDETRLASARKAVEEARKEKEVQEKLAKDAQKQAMETSAAAASEPAESVIMPQLLTPALTPAAMQGPGMSFMQTPMMPQFSMPTPMMPAMMPHSSQLSAMVMPSIPGLPPSGYSQLFNQGVQILPKLLGKQASGSSSGEQQQPMIGQQQLPGQQQNQIQPRDVAQLYVQIVELSEEIARLSEMNDLYKRDLDTQLKQESKLMANFEAVYNDFFKQKTLWMEEKDKLEKDATEKVSLANALEQQVKSLKATLSSSTTGGNSSQAESDREKLVKLMQRTAILEENESKMARKYQALDQDYKATKQILDTIELQASEAEDYLKQKVQQLSLWKQRAESSLSIASKKIQEMVPMQEYEKVNKQLSTLLQREMDLLRRQSDLYVLNAEREDKLRKLVALEEKCADLEQIQIEADFELTTLRNKLESFDGNFKQECFLFRSLVKQLQRKFSHYGEWYTEGMFADETSSEISPPWKKVEDKLKVLNSDHDGFLTLSAIYDFLQSSIASIGGQLELTPEDMETIAKACGGSNADLGHLTMTANQLGTGASTSTGFVGETDVNMNAGGGGQNAAVSWPGKKVSLLAFVSKLRLFGLQKKSGEDLFWAAVKQRVPPQQEQNFFKMLHVFQNNSQFVKLGDIFQVFKTFGLPAFFEENTHEALANAEELQKVAAWCGYDETSAQQVMQQQQYDHLPVRQKLLHIATVNYQDFVTKCKKQFQNASRMLLTEDDEFNPPMPGTVVSNMQQGSSYDASSGIGSGSGQNQMPQQFLFYPEENNSIPQQVVVQQQYSASSRFDTKPQASNTQMAAQIAEWRMAAANRRSGVLEMELKSKINTQKELTKQVQDLENLTLRLEKELHEERQLRANTEIKLAGTITLQEVEPKLKLAESVLFENEQLKIQLTQKNGILQVCAKQSENLERVIKRRQEEKKHLQETIRMLQASDDLELNVGKTQYKLLLAQWERSFANRELSIVSNELKEVRKEELTLTSNFEETKAKKEVELSELREKLAETLLENDKLRQDLSAKNSFSVEKIYSLTNQVEEISKRKSELEEDLKTVRKSKSVLLTQLDEAKEQARQGQELLSDLKNDLFAGVNAKGDSSIKPAALADGSSTVSGAQQQQPSTSTGAGFIDHTAELVESRRKVMQLATKLSDARLQALRNQRKADSLAEQLDQLYRSNDAKEHTIEQLQKQNAHFEVKMQQEEERWRLKLREGQEVMMAIQDNRPAAMQLLNKSTEQAPAGNLSSRQNVSDSQNLRSSMRQKWSLQSGIEDILDKLQKKSQENESLKEDLKHQEEKFNLQLDTVSRKLKNSEIQLKLLQANLGDDAAQKLRQELLREQDEEVKKVGEAAKQSVNLLQSVIDQKEEQLSAREKQIQELQIKIKEDRGYHQQEVNELKTNLIALETQLNVRNLREQSSGASSARIGGGTTNNSGPLGSGRGEQNSSDTALKVIKEHGNLLEKHQTEHEKLQSAIQSKDSELYTLKEKIAQLHREQELYQHERKAMDQKLEQSEKNYEASNLARIVQICRKQLKEKNNEIKNLKQMLEKWKTEQIEQEADKLLAKKDESKMEDEIRQLKKTNRTYEDRLEDMKRRLLTLQDEVIAGKSKEASNAMLNRQSLDSEQKLKALLEDAKKAVTGKIDEVVEKDKRIARLLDRIDDLEIELEQVKKRPGGMTSSPNVIGGGIGISGGSAGTIGSPTTITGMRQRLEDLENENARLKRKIERGGSAGGATAASSSSSAVPSAQPLSGDQSAVRIRDLEDTVTRIRRERDDLIVKLNQQPGGTSPSNSNFGLAQKNDLLRLQVGKLKQRCEKTVEEYEQLTRRARQIFLLLQRGMGSLDAREALQQECKKLLEELDMNSKKATSLDFSKMSQEIGVTSSLGTPTLGGMSTPTIGGAASSSSAFQSGLSPQASAAANQELQIVKQENNRLKSQLDELTALQAKVRRLEQDNVELESLRRRVRDLSSASPSRAGLSIEEESRLRNDLKQTQEKVYELEVTKSRLTREAAERGGSAVGTTTSAAGASNSAQLATLTSRVQQLEVENQQLRLRATSSTSGVLGTAGASSSSSSTTEVTTLRTQLTVAQDQISTLDRRLREEQQELTRLRDQIVTGNVAVKDPSTAPPAGQTAEAATTLSAKELQSLREKVKQFREAYAVVTNNNGKLLQFQKDMRDLIENQQKEAKLDDANVNRVLFQIRKHLATVQFLPETTNPDDIAASSSPDRNASKTDLAEAEASQKQQKVSQSIANLVEKNAALVQKGTNTRELLLKLDKLKSKYDGQVSIASFETATLLRELRRLCQDAKEQGMLAVDVAEGGGAPTTSTPPAASTSSAAAGATTATASSAQQSQTAEIIKKLEEERYSNEELIKELRLKMSKLEDENLSLNRANTRGDSSIAESGRKITDLEKTIADTKQRLDQFHSSITKALKESQDKATVAVRAQQSSMIGRPGSPTSMIRPGGVVGAGMVGSSMYNRPGQVGAVGAATTVPKTIFDQLVAALQAILDTETQKNLLGGRASTAGATSSAAAASSSLVSSLVSGAGGITAAAGVTAAAAAPPIVIDSSTSSTPTVSATTTAAQPTTESVAALQQTVTSLSAENNRLRVQVREQDQQIVNMIQSNPGGLNPANFEGSHSAANASSPDSPDNYLPTNSLTAGLTSAGAAPQLSATAQAATSTANVNEVELLAKKLQQMEDLYTKASTEWQRSVEQVTKLSNANASLSEKLKAMDVFQTIDGEQKQSLATVIQQLEQLEKEKKGYLIEIAKVKELEKDNKALKSDLDRTEILKKRLQEELAGLEYLKLPVSGSSASSKTFAQNVDSLNAGRGVRDLVERVVVLEHKNEELAKELLALSAAATSGGAASVAPSASSSALAGAGKEKGSKSAGNTKATSSSHVPSSSHKKEVSVQEFEHVKKQLAEATKIFEMELSDRTEIFQKRMKTLCAEIETAVEEKDQANAKTEQMQQKMQFSENEAKELKKIIEKLNDRHTVDIEKAGNLANDVRIFERDAERYKLFRSRIEWFQKNLLTDLTTMQNSRGDRKPNDDKEKKEQQEKENEVFLDKLEDGLKYLSKYIDDEATYTAKTKHDLVMSSNLLREDPRAFTDINPAEVVVGEKKTDASTTPAAVDVEQGKRDEKSSSSTPAEEQKASSSTTGKSDTKEQPDQKPPLTEASAERQAKLSVITDGEELKQKLFDSEEDRANEKQRFHTRLAELSAVNIKLEKRLQEVGAMVKVNVDGEPNSVTATEFFQKLDKTSKENELLAKQLELTKKQNEDYPKLKIEKEKLEILFKRQSEDLRALETTKKGPKGSSTGSVDVSSGAKLQELVDKLFYLEAENDELRKSANHPKRSGNYLQKAQNATAGAASAENVRLKKKLAELSKIFDMEMQEKKDLFLTRAKRLATEVELATDVKNESLEKATSLSKKLDSLEKEMLQTKDDLIQSNINYERERTKADKFEQEMTKLLEKLKENESSTEAEQMAAEVAKMKTEAGGSAGAAASSSGQQQLEVEDQKASELQQQVANLEKEKNHKWSKLSEAEKKGELFSSIRSRLTTEGISFLQILKAVDTIVNRSSKNSISGKLPLRIVQKALNQLPLSITAQQLDQVFTHGSGKGNSLTSFLDVDNDNAVKYVEWLAAVLEVANASAKSSSDAEATQEFVFEEMDPVPLKNTDFHFGLLGNSVDPLSGKNMLRGFSLRTALRVVFSICLEKEVEPQNTVVITSDETVKILEQVINSFFEFLSEQKAKVLVQEVLNKVLSSSSSGDVPSSEVEGKNAAAPPTLAALELEFVWLLDTAFLTSRGEYEAKQMLLSEEKETLHMMNFLHKEAESKAENENAPGGSSSSSTSMVIKSKDQGPFAQLRKKVAREKLNIRKLFDKYSAKDEFPGGEDFLFAKNFQQLVNGELPPTVHISNGAETVQPRYSDGLLEYSFEEVAQRYLKKMNYPRGFMQFRDFDLELRGETFPNLFEKIRAKILKRRKTSASSKMGETAGRASSVEIEEEVAEQEIRSALPPSSDLSGAESDRLTYPDLDHFLHKLQFEKQEFSKRERLQVVDEASKSRKEFIWRIRSSHLLQNTIQVLRNTLIENKYSLMDAFTQADEDRDGFLSYVEFKNLFENLNLFRSVSGVSVSKADVSSLFNVLDQDTGSGMLSYQQLQGKIAYPDAVVEMSWATSANSISSSADGATSAEQQVPMNNSASSSSLLSFPEAEVGRSRQKASQWLAGSALPIIKSRLYSYMKQNPGAGLSIRSVFAQFDHRGLESLTAAQFKKAVQTITSRGTNPQSLSEQKEEDAAISRIFEFLVLKQDYAAGASSSEQPNMNQQNLLKLDFLIKSIQAAKDDGNNDNNASKWTEAMPAVSVIHNALNQQKLSLIKLLKELDPLRTGRVLFHSLCGHLARQLNLKLETVRKLHLLVILDKNGMCLADEVSKVILRDFPLRKIAGGITSSANMKSAKNNINLPPLEQEAANKGSSSIKAGGATLTADQQLARKLKKQVENLGKQLKQAEEHKDYLEKEFHKVQLINKENSKANEIRENSKKLEDQVKNLQAELEHHQNKSSNAEIEKLKTTDQYRSQIFELESKIETMEKQLTIDAKELLEQEKLNSKQLQEELDKVNQQCEQVKFELKRVKSIRLGDDWAQREEEYMTINLKVRKLEDLTADYAKQIRVLESDVKKKEMKTMEYLFDKTQWETKFNRMQNRIRELELINQSNQPVSPKGRNSSGKTAGDSSASSSSNKAQPQSKREKNLEAIVEGMETVINKLKKDNHRQIQELERHHKEGKKQGALLAENQRLKQQIEDQANNNSSNTMDFGKKIKQLHDQIEVANLKNAELEQLINKYEPKLELQQEQIEELHMLRQEDKEALDVAQELMQDVTQTEERYRKIVTENKEFKKAVEKYENREFKEKLEVMEIFFASGRPLLQQSMEILKTLREKYPSLAIPPRLVEAMESLNVAAA